MKKLSIIFLLFIITVINAQEKLNKLGAPTSPASSILGLQPSSVLSPKSSQALEASLYSNFLNNRGEITIPNDFALEFTPYWTTNHSLSLENYLYPNDVLEDQIIRNSSFSIASTQKFLLGDSTLSSSLAFGYRTTLYYGNENDKKIIQDFRTHIKNQQKVSSRINAEAEGIVVNNKVKNTAEFLGAITGIVIRTISDYCSAEGLNNESAQVLINKIFKNAESLPPLEKNEDDFLDAFYNLVDEVCGYKIAFEKFKNYIQQRRGLSIDIAFTAMLNFPTNNFEFSFSPCQSLWITPAYHFRDNLSFLKIMGALRYEWYNTGYYKKYFPKSKFYQNNTDYGFAISAEFDKYSIQFEIVGRRSKSEINVGIDANGNQLYTIDRSTEFQYIGTFSFRLSDQIILNYSLGNCFKRELNPANTLLSLLTLNFGFGTPTEKDLDFSSK